MVRAVGVGCRSLRGRRRREDADGGTDAGGAACGYAEKYSGGRITGGSVSAPRSPLRRLVVL